MNRLLKKLPGLFAILFITGVLTAVIYPESVEVKAAAPLVLNGHQLSATQSKWVNYIANEVVPLLPGNANERAAMAARGTWWSLEEGVLSLGNPIGYSNCAQLPGEGYVGNNHIGFTTLCEDGV